LCFPNIKLKENKADWFLEADNGSTYWIAGLDDKERIEKILGNEYATIHINEGSQISYDGYETLKTRLNAPKPVKGKILIDYNPPSVKHWGYQIFHERKDPITKQLLTKQERYGRLLMNPYDNIDNLSDDYIETLESMSEAKRRRFLTGEYSDGSEFALWKWDWIIENRVKQSPTDFSRVVVAVDPAVSNTENSDDTGIVVIGEYNKEYYVIGDYTYSGDVTGWGQKVVEVYNKHNADMIIGEVNQGGDLVEMNIRNYGRLLPYKSVRATRGKAVRAEPIADLYRRGMVHHVGEYAELEEQMTTWEPGSDSPDNMDALVWGLSYLTGNIGASNRVKITGF
jgi:phage terminase large subunit-like protein